MGSFDERIGTPEKAARAMYVLKIVLNSVCCAE